jgi:cyanate lyase
MLQNIEEKLYNAKAEAKRFFEEAKALTGGISPTDPAFYKFRRVFHVLGDTVEELDNELQDTQAKADCLGETDDTVS